jgi:hypothetical protein
VNTVREYERTGQNGNGTATAKSSSKAPTATAATDLPLGGGPSTAAAPFPGKSHQDIYGPDDNWVSGASPALVGMLSFAGVAVAAGVGGWLVLV